MNVEFCEVNVPEFELEVDDTRFRPRSRLHLGCSNSEMTKLQHRAGGGIYCARADTTSGINQAAGRGTNATDHTAPCSCHARPDPHDSTGRSSVFGSQQRIIFGLDPHCCRPRTANDNGIWPPSFKTA
jgi:hypothetical protein